MEKDGQEIVYRTSDLQALYGLSNKGLFFYEGQGLIAPQRADGNRYRVYTLEETARIHRCKVFRQMGFSVEESIDMVCGSTPRSLLERLSQRQKEICRQALWQNLVSEEIEKKIQLINCVEAGKIPFDLCMRPLMRRVSLRNTIENVWTKEKARENQNWQKYLPVAEASLQVEPETISADTEVLTVNLGFIILEESLKRWGEALPSQAVILPQRECLYTVISGPDNVLNRPERFAAALAWVKAHGYRLSGAIVTRMIATLDAGDGMQRYDEAWLPVEKF